MQLNLRRLLTVAILLPAIFAAFSCTQESPPSERRVLNLAIWSNYLSPESLTEFEKTSGVKLRISHYSSNEELLARLQAGASGYDVIVPSDYMVLTLRKLGLLRKLEIPRLPNFKNIDARYLKKRFDPTNEYSVPYDVGTTGIAVNRDLYRGNLTGWKDLFNEATLEGKVSLLDDARETIGAALKALGLSLNTRDPKELAMAKEVLLKARKNIKAFNSETLSALTQGEVAVAHAYVSDTLQARKLLGGKVEYVFPREGGTLWIDNLCIPSTAQNVEAAHAFINFLLEGRISASTTQAVFVGPVNQAAIQLLPPSFRKEYAPLFASETHLKSFEMIEDLGEALPLWDRIWTEIKAAGI